MLMVIDGADGAGKKTQTNLLVSRLKKEGRKAEKIQFPQYKKSSGLAEEYLSGKYGSLEEVGPYRASIFYACDRYDASFKIRNWLNQGTIVISDRYVTANMGHQGAKIENSEERKKYFDWLYDLEYNIFNIPKPDLNIILHVPAEIAFDLAKNRKREDWKGKTRDIHEEDFSHLKKAELVYLEIAKTIPNCVLIECAKSGALLSREEIHGMVWETVKIKQGLEKILPNPC